MSRPTCCCSVSLGRCDRCDLLVDLEGFHLMGVARTPDALVLDVESCNQLAGCPGCGLNRPRPRSYGGEGNRRAHGFMTSSPRRKPSCSTNTNNTSRLGHSGVRSKILLLHLAKDLQHVTPSFVTRFYNSLIIYDTSLTCNQFLSNHSPFESRRHCKSSTEDLHL